jgi:hypothetical protein
MIDFIIIASTVLTFFFTMAYLAHRDARRVDSKE